MVTGIMESEQDDQPLPVNMDPTAKDLLAHDREYLATLLLREEAKHGKKGILKTKEWKAFDHEISRSSKRYRAVIVLGPQQEMPSSDIRRQEKERTRKSVIYLKKYRDGHIEACAGVKKQPKTVTLTPDQLKKLHDLDRPGTVEMDLNDECYLAEAFSRLNEAQRKQDKEQIRAVKNEIARLSREIKKTRKFISGIQEACGYTRYRYRDTLSPKKQQPEGKGTFGRVNPSYGKLVLVEEEDGVIRTQYRESKKDRITKFIPIKSNTILVDTLREMALLKLPVMKAMLGSKDDATIQRDRFGRIESIRITEDRAPGFELAVLLDEAKSNHRHTQSLNNEERYQLVPLLLEALCAIHAKHIADRRAGIVHRDISAKNIMVYRAPDTGALSVKIIDPGLARRAVIKDRLLRGSPLYIAPEMWAKKEGDQEGDDYSLGVVLRKLLDDPIMCDPGGDGNGRQHWTSYEIEFVARAEYDLGISMPKPDCAVLNALKDQNPDPERVRQIAVTEQIVYGMTQTARGDRWSAEKSLALYRGQPFQEEKTAQVHPHDIRSGIATLEQLKDYVDAGYKYKQRGKKESLLVAVFDQLADLVRSEGDRNPVHAFVKTCRHLCLPAEKISDNILPTVIGLASLVLHQEKYVNKNNPDAEKNRKAILSQLQKAVEHGYKIREPKIPYGDYVKTARNNTWLNNFNGKECQHINFFDYFTGWPRGKNSDAFIRYVCLGFLLIPLKNTLKLVEFLPEFLAQSTQFLIDRTVRTQPTGIGKLPRWATLAVLYPVQVVTTVISRVMSLVTYPLVFFDRCFARREPLGDSIRERIFSTSTVFFPRSSTAFFSERMSMDLSGVSHDHTKSETVLPLKQNDLLQQTETQPLIKVSQSSPLLRRSR